MKRRGPKKPLTDAQRCRRGMCLLLGAIRQVGKLARGPRPELEGTYVALSKAYRRLMQELDEIEGRTQPAEESEGRQHA